MWNPNWIPSAGNPQIDKTPGFDARFPGAGGGVGDGRRSRC